MIGVHDRQHEPCGDVLAEPLELHDRRAAFVAEDLVAVTLLVLTEAEVCELGRGQPLFRHRGRAQRRERFGCHTTARCSLRCSSRSARYPSRITPASATSSASVGSLVTSLWSSTRFSQ